MTYFTEEEVPAEVEAHGCIIDFQKRGLPYPQMRFWEGYIQNLLSYNKISTTLLH